MAVTVKISQSGTWVSPGRQTRSASVSVTNGNSNNVTATCNAGEVPIAGGCDWAEDSPNLVVNTDRPDPTSGTPTGWYCRGRNGKGSGGATLAAYVVCLAV